MKRSEMALRLDASSSEALVGHLVDEELRVFMQR